MVREGVVLVDAGLEGVNVVCDPFLNAVSTGGASGRPCGSCCPV